MATLLAGAGLAGHLAADVPLQWDALYGRLAYQPILYARGMVDYQLAYLRADGPAVDLSLVLQHDGRPAGIWPLTVQPGQALTSQGLPVLPPAFVPELPRRSVKAMVAACLALTEALAAANGIGAWQAAGPFRGEPAPGIDAWQEQLLARGAAVEVAHELFVDLSMPMAGIRTHMRKSYKPLAALAARTWQSDVVYRPGGDIWAEFRALHHAAAGRQTRPDSTWDLQHAALLRGEGFLVTLRDGDGRLVGCGHFTTSAHEGDYSTAAYDRALFDRPLGHLVQVRAIEEMQRLGLRWYRIGRRPFPGERPAPSAKELSIGAFKQGFATHLMPLFTYRVGAAAPGTNAGDG